MGNILLIFLGAGLGGVCRYLVATGTHLFINNRFPYGTLLVNISGSLVMGILFTLFLDRFQEISSPLRAFFLIGVLGGYTTFSSFSIETVNLIENGAIVSAMMNMFLSVILCVGTAWLGVLLGRQL